MLTVVIQAGGSSRRMGQDKGLLEFLGEPLVVRLVQRVKSIAGEIILVTNQPEPYQFLELPLVGDDYPGRGALGGLYTALRAASNPYVAVVACDMPFVNSDILSAAHTLALQTRADAVIPRTRDGLEPFHAVYHRPACLPHIQAALEAGLWRVDAWLPQANVHYLEGEQLASLDPTGRAFMNLNTPTDLVAAQKLARSSNQV